MLNSGAKYNILKKSGTWFVYNDQKLGQGIDAARQYLKEAPKLIAEMTKKVKDAAREAS